MIVLQKARRTEARAFIPGQRLVRTRSMHVAPQQAARAVMFSYQRVAVVEELRRSGRSAAGLEQPAERVPSERRTVGGRDEAVLGVVDIGPRAVAGEVAVRIVSKARRPGARILIEAVDAVGAVDIVMAGERIGVVVARQGDDLACRIVSERARHAPGAAGQAFLQRRQPVNQPSTSGLAVVRNVYIVA